MPAGVSRSGGARDHGSHEQRWEKEVTLFMTTNALVKKTKILHVYHAMWFKLNRRGSQEVSCFKNNISFYECLFSLNVSRRQELEGLANKASMKIRM